MTPGIALIINNYSPASLFPAGKNFLPDLFVEYTNSFRREFNPENSFSRMLFSALALLLVCNGSPLKYGADDIPLEVLGINYQTFTAGFRGSRVPLVRQRITFFILHRGVRISLRSYSIFEITSHAWGLKTSRYCEAGSSEATCHSSFCKPKLLLSGQCPVAYPNPSFAD